MANQYDTDLIVRAITEGFDKVSADIHGVGSSVDEASEQAGRGTTRWTELNSALNVTRQVFGGVKEVAEATWNQMKRGAEIDLTTRRFDRLAESIGTTGDALRRDLHDGIGSLMSDADQMQLATDLMALGLVKNQTEAARLATIAGQMGMDMNQLVLTLTNNTTARFDQMGVAVDGFQEKWDTLKDAGYGAQEAFKLAFMDQAEEGLERVGGLAGTTAGNVATLESTWRNLQDAFALGTAEGAAESLQFVADNAVAATDVVEELGRKWGEFWGNEITKAFGGVVVLEKWKQALDEGKISQDQYTQGTIRLRLGVVNFEQSMTELEGALRETDAVSGEFNDKLVQMENRSHGAAGGVDDLADSASSATPKLFRLTQAMNWSSQWLADGRQAMDDAKNSTDELSDSTVRLSDIVYLTPERYQAGERAVAEYNKRIEEGTDLNYSFGSSVDEAAVEMERLAAATGNYFQQARKAKEFNPIDALLDAYSGKGRNALDMARAGVAGGLFSQDEANKFLGIAAMKTQADILAGMSDLAPEEAARLMLQMQSDLENNQDLANQFFSSIVDEPHEAVVSLDTTGAYAQLSALNDDIAKPVTKPVNLSTSGNNSITSDEWDDEFTNRGLQ